MSDDSDGGSDLSAYGIFDSCSELGETLDNDDYWCWEVKEGDYSSIWNVIGLIYFMYAAQFLIFYSGFMNQNMDIRAIRIPSNSSIPIPKFIYNNNASSDFLSLLLSLIVHIIYIFIKIAIISKSYMTILNDQYDTLEFQQFVNARNILIMAIITLKPDSFIINQVLFRRRRSNQNTLQKTLIIPFGYILLATDTIFTIIILGIYYSLFGLLCYWFAIGLLGIIVIFCVFSCLIACCIGVIARCCVNGCIELGIDNESGDTIIGFKSIFMKFIFLSFWVIIMLALYVCVGIWEIYFAFYFLDGPPHNVYFVDFNKNADSVIYWLFILSVSFGVAAFLATIVSLCYSLGSDDRDRRGVHSQLAQSDND